MKSTLKTTSAVLRWIIKEKDLVWAEKLGKSVSTVRHLEAGTLKLPPAIATRMNYETGISIMWLMDGNPADPIAQDGREYTKAIYDEVQAKHFTMPAAFGSFTLSGQDVDLTTVDNNWAIGHNALQFFGNICAILVSANRKRKYQLACYRLAKAIQELGNELGAAKELLDDYPKALAYVFNEKNFENVTGFKFEFIQEPAFKPESKQPLKKKKHR